MRKLKRIITSLHIVACLGIAVPLSTYAATQGSLGTTSTGTVDITLEIPAQVRITALNDIELTPTVLTSDVTGSTTACIYSASTVTSGGYQVTATSDNNGGGGSFFVKEQGAGTETIEYTATWHDGGSASPSSMTEGSPLTGQENADTVSTNCSGTGPSTNATFEIKFLSADLTTASVATYEDTVTLVVAPT